MKTKSCSGVKLDSCQLTGVGEPRLPGTRKASQLKTSFETLQPWKPIWWPSSLNGSWKPCYDWIPRPMSHCQPFFSSSFPDIEDMGITSPCGMEEWHPTHSIGSRYWSQLWQCSQGQPLDAPHPLTAGGGLPRCTTMRTIQCSQMGTTRGEKMASHLHRWFNVLPGMSSCSKPFSSCSSLIFSGGWPHSNTLEVMSVMQWNGVFGVPFSFCRSFWTRTFKHWPFLQGPLGRPFSKPTTLLVGRLKGLGTNNFKAYDPK